MGRSGRVDHLFGAAGALLTLPTFLTVTEYLVGASVVERTVVRAGGGVLHLTSNSV